MGESSSTSVYDQALHLRPRLVATVTESAQVGDHVEYTIIIEAAGHQVGLSQQRYSAFRALHSRIAKELELSSSFPVPKAFFNTRRVVSSRVTSLGKYIDDVLSAASASGTSLPPPLQTFLRLNRSSAVVSGLEDLGGGLGSA